MIDIESIVFSEVATVLREKFTGIFVAGEYVDVPAKFPAVTITESDNSVANRMRTDKIENAVNLMYEVNVYSNLVKGKKQQAKDVMEVIDGIMEGLGFTRTTLNPISNLSDATIYRLVARYEATVDHDNWVYQST